MDATDLARWQFAITTVYHFLFVPITIGLSAVVAYYHTRYVRTRDASWMQLAKFFGKLFTINFALGLVTGIVQEFQFGMNWSDYSRFVGDIFGAPLAVEALLAFFLESTFLGLWIFGWGRLPKKLHAATMWLVHIGTVLSAYFILAANSFMQNPVGYTYNEQTGRAELTDFVAVLTNKVQLVTFPHVLASAYMVAGALVMGVALHKMRQTRLAEQQSAHVDTRYSALYRRAARGGAVLCLVASIGVVVSGDLQGKIMTEVQPMKMAAAEAIYDSVPEGEGAPFSVLSIGGLDGQNATRIIEVPGLLSFLATGSFTGPVEGISDLRAQYEQRFGSTGTARLADPDTGYVPNIPTTYWTFRLMMGAGFLAMAISALVLWTTRGNRVVTARWATTAGVLAALSPVLAMSFGWIFTEVGRQPWVVFGLMTTASGVSPGVSAGEVAFSMVAYTLLYGALAVVEVRLFLLYVRRGLETPSDAVHDVHADGPGSGSHASDRGADDELVFAY